MKNIKWGLLILSVYIITGCNNLPIPDYYILYTFNTTVENHKLNASIPIEICVRVEGEILEVDAINKTLNFINNNYVNATDIIVNIGTDCYPHVKLDDLK